MRNALFRLGRRVAGIIYEIFSAICGRICCNILLICRRCRGECPGYWQAGEEQVVSILSLQEGRLSCVERWSWLARFRGER